MPLGLLTAKNNESNILGIHRRFWTPTFCDELVDSAIGWRPIVNKYGKREVAAMNKPLMLCSSVVPQMHEYNRKTYRIPDLGHLTPGQGLYRYSRPGDEYRWHQDIIFNLDMLKKHERVRRYSAIVMLSDYKDYEGAELEFEDFTKPVALGKGDLLLFTSLHFHRVKPLISGARHTFCVWWESHHYAHTLEVV